MTTLVIVLGCIAFTIIVGMVRGKPGRAVADTALLVIVFGIITVADFAIRWFMDTGEAASWVAIAFAAGMALDSLYGLMAPERQKQRDKKLRRLMKKRA
ncbi:MAG: hypothetical protein V4502_05565 [Pseudomonadota bacterium]